MIQKLLFYVFSELKLFRFVFGGNFRCICSRVCWDLSSNLNIFMNFGIVAIFIFVFIFGPSYLWTLIAHQCMNSWLLLKFSGDLNLFYRSFNPLKTVELQAKLTFIIVLQSSIDSGYVQNKSYASFHDQSAFYLDFFYLFPTIHLPLLVHPELLLWKILDAGECRPFACVSFFLSWKWWLIYLKNVIFFCCCHQLCSWRRQIGDVNFYYFSQITSFFSTFKHLPISE